MKWIIVPNWRGCVLFGAGEPLPWQPWSSFPNADGISGKSENESINGRKPFRWPVGFTHRWIHHTATTRWVGDIVIEHETTPIELAPTLVHPLVDSWPVNCETRLDLQHRWNQLDRGRCSYRAATAAVQFNKETFWPRYFVPFLIGLLFLCSAATHVERPSTRIGLHLSSTRRVSTTLRS